MRLELSQEDLKEEHQGTDKPVTFGMFKPEVQAAIVVIEQGDYLGKTILPE